MSEKFIAAGVTILVGIVGVAALSVLVSRNSQTVNVITQATTGFKNALCTALSPIGVKCASTNPLESVTSRVIW
jgi:hypothetical protein